MRFAPAIVRVPEDGGQAVKIRLALLGALAAGLALPAGCAYPPWLQRGDPAPLLLNARQLTFDGRRSGEAYWSADGTQLVFQSEREPGNPFYQIYRMELASGAVRRVSPGMGKTTCAWFHPSGDRILFASTHHDPATGSEMRAELEQRASGEQRRYAWDYDPEFELWSARPDGSGLLRLTASPGYDAEGSYSPDGDWIVFASNRHAYLEPLDDQAAAHFARDPAWGMELYRMRADGSGSERLTHTPGYDGGPFWSPDGARIVWRRFAEDGLTAEIYSMAADGSDVRQLTRLRALSWAPFYHPSGAYLVFATNRHGFANFELYLVDTDGRREPLRVTNQTGFDGLPVFSPDGRQLAWSRTRKGQPGAQVFLADWDHAEALRRLTLRSAALRRSGAPLPPAALGAAELRRHVARLTAGEMAGRATGSPGERRATAYVAEAFEALGLQPAGDEGGWFQGFEFTSGVALGVDNRLVVDGEGERWLPERDWQPLAFSRTGRAAPAPVVFAGYGIVAPAHGESPAYDAYAGLDVSGRWVLTLRYLPEDVPAERRQHLNRFAGLRYKAMLARERGALGLIVVTGPRSPSRDPLVRLRVDVALAGTSVFAVSVTPELAGALLGGRDLAALQQALDGGAQPPGFEVPGLALAAAVDLVHERSAGRNVLARLHRGGDAGAPPVVIGAHVDHIGDGSGGTSLAQDDERGRVHPGADDNASGVAALLAIARWLAGGSEPLARDVVFAAWSGEELGLLGSSHWASLLDDPDAHAVAAARDVSAYLNMDMVGRFDEQLVVHGMGSSPGWVAALERGNAVVGLPVSAQPESYLPTDTTPFYLKGVPVLSAFTGSHGEYHTPRDTRDRLDYESAARIAWLIGRIAQGLAQAREIPEYAALEHPGSGPARGSIRVYLGTIPNYGRSDVAGVALSGVSPGGPAARAGLRAGDVIVELAGRAIENIYDYTYALDALAVGKPAELVVLRGGERVPLSIVPDPRE